MRARIIPDAATNRLILCGTKEDLDQISLIVDQIDKPSGQPSGFEDFPAQKFQSLPIAADRLQLFEQPGWPPEGRGPALDFDR